MTFCQILKEVSEEKKKYFENYKFYCQRLKESAEKILGRARLIVFGSIIMGKFNPRSDIDILIISENLPKDDEERAIIRTKLKASIAPFSPFQIHLATPQEYQTWYQKFIKESYEEI